MRNKEEDLTIKKKPRRSTVSSDRLGLPDTDDVSDFVALSVHDVRVGAGALRGDGEGLADGEIAPVGLGETVDGFFAVLVRDGEAVLLRAVAGSLVFAELRLRPGGFMIRAGGGGHPGRGPSPDIIIILGGVAGNLAVDRLLDGLGVILGLVDGALVLHLLEIAVAQIIVGVIGFIMIDDTAGALDLHILIVVKDAVVVVDLLALRGELRAVGQVPAGFAVLNVLLDLDVPLPGEGRNRQIPGGFVAVHVHEEADDGDDGYQEENQPAFALRRGLGLSLSLGRGLGRRHGCLLGLLFLQHVEVVGLGALPAGAAVGAELGVVAVEGIAEGAVPVRIAAGGLRLLLIHILDIRRVPLLPGLRLGVILHIKLNIAPGTAAGGTVDCVAPDALGAADGAVPVSHDKLSHI